MELEIENIILTNIALDIFSIILTSLLLVYLLSGKRYQQQTNWYFLCVALSNIFMIIGDLADWTLRDITEPWMETTLLILTLIYYSASAFMLWFFTQYIIAYLKIPKRVKKICLGFVMPACVVQIVFAMISPFTGAIFFVTDDGYQRGSLFIVSQLVPLFCYLVFTALVMIYRRKLKRREVVSFLLYIFMPFGCNVAQMLIRGIAVVNIGVTLALLFILMNIQLENEIALWKQTKELAEQKTTLAEQRVQLLLSQIQSHFLFNSLGTIAELCRLNPKAAEKATEEFASFLRGNMMSLNTNEPIPFEKEMDHVKSYLYLERQRLQERLQVDYDIETTDFLIPPLSLQPLVENAVRHGICHRKEGGHVTIRTKKTDEYAVVTIADDGIGMDRAREQINLGKHASIGISNVRHRVETMVKGRMEIKSSDKGTAITIWIPWIGGI